jgi:hypothetical protein
MSSGKNNNELSTEKQEEIKKFKNKLIKYLSLGVKVYFIGLTVFISFEIPSIIAIYWIFRSVLSFIKDFVFYKFFPTSYVNESPLANLKTFNNNEINNPETNADETDADETEAEAEAVEETEITTNETIKT